MSTATLLPPPRFVAVDANGEPLSAGFVYTYVPGGTTPKTTWQDQAETIPNANPIILDADGSCLLYGSGSYQITTTDSLGNAVPTFSGLSTDLFSLISNTVAVGYPAIANIAALRAATSATLASTQGYVLGYYAPADGGEGPFVYVSSDISSSDNGGTIIVDASNRRWYRETGGAPYSIKWFGAKMDGTTDDTAANVAAISAAEAASTTVTMPAGNTKVTSALSVTGKSMWISGAGAGATTVTSTITDGSVFSFTSSSGTGGLSDLRIVGPSGATAGSGVYVNSGAITLTNLNIQQTYNGVTWDANGNAGRAINVDVSGVVNNGFMFAGGHNNVYLENCTAFQKAGSPGNAGYQVNYTQGGPWLSNCVAAGFTLGLAIGTIAGQKVVDMFVENCDFDSSIQSGIFIDSSSGGTIYALKFTNTRGSFSQQNGIAINGSATYDLQFANCEFSANAEDGIIVLGGNYIGFSNCVAAGNAALGGSHNGLHLVGGTGIRFVGSRCGPYAIGTNNQDFGVVIETTFTGSAVITDNDLSGNVTAGVANGSTSNQIFITDNVGYNPVGTSVPTVGSSPWTYAALGTPQTLFLNGGTVSGVTIGGNTVASASPATIPLQAGQSAVVTYSAAPAAVVSIQ